MGDLKVVQEFIKVLLQWNYGEMFKKFGDGEGMVEHLPSVPKSFQGLEVTCSISPRCSLRCDVMCLPQTVFPRTGLQKDL